MNTFLKLIALITAAATPVAFAAEAYGLSLPLALHSSTFFGVFVATLTVLTMVADYTGAKRISLTPAVRMSAAGISRTTLPLAA